MNTTTALSELWSGTPCLPASLPAAPCSCWRCSSSLARMLGDEDYGKFSFALALATIFETFVDFGLKEIATRSVARGPSRVAHRLVSNTVGLKLVLAVATMVALLLVARLLRAEADVRLVCYLLGDFVGAAVLSPHGPPPPDGAGAFRAGQR